MMNFTDWDIVCNLLLAARWTLLLSLTAFFGLGLFGINVSPWTAAALALTLFTSAFLVDIWHGSIVALPKGQWEASRCLGLSFGQTLCRVVAPQAMRIAIAPTVGFSVQVIKGKALASIIGFIELTKAGTMLNNVTYQPFKVFGLVALGYFLMCYPLPYYSRYLEKKFNAAHHHYQVQKYYGQNHVLKGVDLDIDMGEVVSIIGRSGSGKNTLLLCINGLEGYQEGSIKLGGVTVTNRDSQAREISRSVGMVFQNFNLFPHMSALENVMLAPRLVLKKSEAECRALGEQMLAKVGLSERLHYSPANLSGGQQQRVAIARALFANPQTPELKQFIASVRGLTEA